MSENQRLPSHSSHHKIEVCPSQCSTNTSSMFVAVCADSVQRSTCYQWKSWCGVLPTHTTESLQGCPYLTCAAPCQSSWTQTCCLANMSSSATWAATWHWCVCPHGTRSACPAHNVLATLSHAAPCRCQPGKKKDSKLLFLLHHL